jgi:hypothetical protein
MMNTGEAIIRDINTNTDFEVRSLDEMRFNESTFQHPWWYNLKYLVA